MHHKYLNHLYYQEKDVDDKFKHECIGNAKLNVTRMINNLDAWQVMSLTMKDKPKNLVLALWPDVLDPQAYLTKEKLKEICEVVSNLLKMRFPLYIWQKGEVIPLTSAHLNQLNEALDDYNILPYADLLKFFPVLDFMSAGHHDDIIQKTAEQNKLETNTIHVLDRYWLDVLFHKTDQLPPRKLTVPYTSFDSKPIEEKTSFLLSLKNLVPPVKEIVCQLFPVFSENNLLDIRKILPDVPVKFSYDNLNLDTQDVTQLLDQKCVYKNKGVIELKGLENKSFLKIANLRSMDDQMNLYHLLYFMPNLQYLNVHLDGRFISERNKNQPLNLNALSSAAKKLNDLYIFASSISMSYEFSGKQFSALNKLSLFMVESDENTLIKWLDTAKHLQILSLKNVKLHSTDSKLLPLDDLLALENLTLVNSSTDLINNQCGKLILTAAKNLRSLTVEKLSEEIIKDISFHQLEYLNLKSVTVFPGFMSDHLKYIELQSCAFRELDLSAVKFSKLISLKLKSTSCTEVSLRGLLSHTENLKEITISHCGLKEDQTIVRHALPLKSLENLSLSATKITSYFLSDLLNQAVNLKTLNLDSCTGALSGTGFTDQLSLRSLESITIKNTHITPSFLDKLLVQAINLKEINLTNCTFDESNEMLVNVLPLHSLAILKITNMTIPAAVLDHIQCQAPTLTNIEIQNSNIVGKVTFSLTKITELAITLGTDYYDFDNETDNNEETILLQLPDLLSEANNLKKMSIKNASENKNLILFNPISSLESLSLSKLDFTLIDLFNTFPCLKSLALTNIKIQDEDLSTLKDLPLETLIIDKAETEDEEIKESLEKLVKVFTHQAKQLKSLSINDIDVVLNDLTALTTLESLVLDCVKLSRLPDESKNPLKISTKKLTLKLIGSLDKHLATFLSPALESLEITGCRLNKKAINQLSHQTLSNLTLSNIILTQEQFIQLLKVCAPYLKSLMIINSSMENVCDPQINEIIEASEMSVTIDGMAWSDYLQKEQKINTTTESHQIVGEGSEKKDKKKKKLIRINNIQHDPTQMLSNALPTDPDTFQFNFVGENKTQDQQMIIEKLSQYLTLSGSIEKVYIAKMQDGMCDALSALFQKKKLSEWDALIQTIDEWNGKALPPKESKCHEYFKDILDDYIKLYVKGEKLKEVWLGENFDGWISQPSLEDDCSFLLGNPWHTIAIKRINDTWFVYDPNFTDGYRIVEDDEALKNQVTNCLGHLITCKNVISTNSKNNIACPGPVISDTASFIREGGLLVLGQERCDISSLIKFLPLVDQLKLSLKDLTQGLLIKNVNGRPAWTAGIRCKNEIIKQYTKALIDEFLLREPEGHSILIKSISLLPNYEQNDIISFLFQDKPQTVQDEITISSKAAKHPPYQFIRQALHKQQEKTRLAKKLETWKQTPNKRYQHPLEYCQYLVNGVLASGEKQNKWLVKLPTSAAVLDMSIAIQKYCASIGDRPVRYIHSPDELICSGAYIEKQKDGTGIIKTGHGGSFYDFLTTSQASGHRPPVLNVNFDNFDADDFVRLNSLLDKDPNVDGVRLPLNTVVIGLINPNKPGYYKGADFHSRFGAQGRENYSGPLPTPMERMPEIKRDHPEKVFLINFYHGLDWQDKLFGHWVINNDGVLVFTKGIFEEALESGLPICIENGPWEDKEFTYFWHKISEIGRIDLGEKRYHFTKNTFVQRNGHDWQQLSKQIEYSDHQLLLGAKTLNPHNLNRFFEKSKCNNDIERLLHFPGWIESHKGEVLHLNVTREIASDEWARLLARCAENNVNLICHLASSVELTNELKEILVAENGLDDNVIIPESSWGKVIESDDIDVTIAKYTADENWKIIDVSECSSPDILIKTDAKFDINSKNFRFKESYSVLLDAIQKGENVVLKGNFSPDLVDALAPLLLKQKDKKENVKVGKILLISEDASLFNYMNIDKHTVTLEDKKVALQNEFEKLRNKAKKSKYGLAQSFKDFRLDDAEIKQSSLNHLRAKLAYHLAGLKSDPWHGLTGLSNTIALPEFDEGHTKEKAENFIKERREAIDRLLDCYPYAFLTGLTGVGKSTFVEKHLENVYVCRDLKEWVLDDQPPGIRKVYFADEANTQKTDWSQFEGLFNDPPGILIEGKYYPLTDHHKVIFAGNPLNYGGRHMPALFADHGGALEFSPMPQEFIYEYILRPVFENTVIEQDALRISKAILARYAFLCKHSKDEILISPRELQMMALLIISHVDKIFKNNKDANIDIDAITNYFASRIARNLLPEEHRKEFDLKFPSSPAVLDDEFVPFALSSHKADKFLVTASRQSAYEHLDEVIQLREYRLAEKVEERGEATLNAAQLYGGLGATIFEGEPGIGKSEIVKAYLLANGFTEIKPKRPKKNEIKEKEADLKELPKNAFYYLPAGMDLALKKSRLIEAFDKGLIVIMDEWNSTPIMEGLLNDLLMGKSPTGKAPSRPGFMLIATQNPFGEGRFKQSKAVERRSTKLTLPAYTTKELEQILKFKGMKENQAKELAELYQAKSAEYASIVRSHVGKKEELGPPPTFRTLIDVADIELEPEFLAQLKFTTSMPVEHYGAYQVIFDEVGLPRTIKKMKQMQNAESDEGKEPDEKPSKILYLVNDTVHISKRRAAEIISRFTPDDLNEIYHGRLERHTSSKDQLIIVADKLREQYETEFTEDEKIDKDDESIAQILIKERAVNDNIINLVETQLLGYINNPSYLDFFKRRSFNDAYFQNFIDNWHLDPAKFNLTNQVENLLSPVRPIRQAQGRPEEVAKRLSRRAYPEERAQCVSRRGPVTEKQAIWLIYNDLDSAIKKIVPKYRYYGATETVGYRGMLLRLEKVKQRLEDDYPNQSAMYNIIYMEFQKFLNPSVRINGSYKYDDIFGKNGYAKKIFSLCDEEMDDEKIKNVLEEIDKCKKNLALEKSSDQTANLEINTSLVGPSGPVIKDNTSELIATLNKIQKRLVVEVFCNEKTYLKKAPSKH